MNAMNIGRPLGNAPISPQYTQPRFIILSVVAGLILVAVLFIAFYRKTIGPRIQYAWEEITAFFRRDGTAKIAIGPGQEPVLTATLNPEPTVLLPPLTKPLFPAREGALISEPSADGIGPSDSELLKSTTTTTTTPTPTPILEYDESVSELPEPVYVPKAGDSPPGDSVRLQQQEWPAGMPGSIDALGTMPSTKASDGKEVFTISNNVYTFNDAAAVCAAAGAELATYDQVKAAYEGGAEWCNYGWIKGQMAVYPTQKETWQSLQKGPSEFRNACGRPGINGGYFDNPDLRFGVTCYGSKPARKPADALIESQVALPQSTEEIQFQKNVQKFRDQLDTAVILPFNKGTWNNP